MDETQLSSHFRFGENWRSFAETLTEAQIEEAVAGLARLVPAAEMAGRSFLDVGCGSGLSMLAALRLGAGRVHGIDIDPASIEASRAILSSHAPGGAWSVAVGSVFDSEAGAAGGCDIVHSWGVLHHTGAMWRAVEACAARVAPGGLLVLALYHRTPLCGAWRIEKRFYAHAPAPAQALIRGAYKAGFMLRQLAAGRPPRTPAGYRSRRGMDWHHDVHDWLGGYPYESTLPMEVERRLKTLHFAPERIFENCAGTFGLFGTGCDEYVARRMAD